MSVNKKLNTTATARLKQDYLRIKRDPVPYIIAEPLHSNILHWYYVVKGPENTTYENGYYFGKLIFPNDFPFKPPSIYVLTPNGRFAINTRLCLSISDFHPDTWNPAWSVSTILTGLLSFMLEKSATLGSIETSDYTKRQLAYQSGPFNLKDSIFCELFPDLVQEIKNNMEKREEELRNSATNHLPFVNSSTNGGEGGVAGADPNGFINGALTNVVVVIVFAIFAYVVKQIILSVSIDE